MKQLLLKIEPVIWLLFGMGIMVGTILLTGWILVIGILEPLGLVHPHALSYFRASQLAATLPAKLVLLAICVLPLWKGAHHLRSLSLDFGGGGRDTAVALLLYGIAAYGSVVAVLAVIRL